MPSPRVGLKSLTGPFRASQRVFRFVKKFLDLFSSGNRMPLYTNATCSQKRHVVKHYRYVEGMMSKEKKEGEALRVAQSKGASGGLTGKQAHFARCIAAGSNQSDAYREAYSVGPDTKASTVNEAASRLMANSKVRARVERLIREKERGVLASALSDRERVLSKLRNWMDTADSTMGNQLRAAELLGRSVGLFKDVVETTDTRSSADLLDELEAVLAAIDDGDDAETIIEVELEQGAGQIH